MNTTDQQLGSDLIGQRQQRIHKVEKLRSMGIEPYTTKANRTNNAGEIVGEFEKFENKKVTVSGRLMTFRDHGKLVFGDLQDYTGRIQLYIKEGTLKPFNKATQNLGLAELELIDIGDIVEATGIVTKTERGVISILVEEFKILTKALRPLPSKWSGIKDRETLFRQRYLDLIMNPQKRSRFEASAKITFAIRKFLNERGFLEIKTPMMQPLHGGTNAKPFITHMNALDVDFYFAVAHELYLKRLITAGFENVFNIPGYFRNEGIDRSHNPEFQMPETMSAYHNYEFNMELMEDQYKFVAKDVFNKTAFTVSGQEVDFSKPFERISMLDAVKKYAGVDFNTIKTVEQAQKALTDLGYKDELPNTVGECMVELCKFKVEEKLIQPTFVTGHPVEISPLAKRMPSDSRFVERFEIFIGGIEQGDNWTELNDPQELYQRFKDQLDKKNAGADDTQPMDIDFIETMEYGMPPTTGVGPGIERMVMTFTETDYIDDVIFFPILKPATATATQKELYGEKYVLSNEKSVVKQDFSKKMAVVLNENLSGWQLTNTIGHITAYLGNKINDFHSVNSFETKDGIKLNPNSQYAVVSYAGELKDLRSLATKLSDSDFKFIIFTQDMIDSGDDKELTKMYLSKDFVSLEILGIGIFGDKDDLKKLLNKFSLWK